MNDGEPLGGPARGDTPDATRTTAVKWAALHDAARAVAALAGRAAADVAPSDFSTLFAAAHGWRKALAETAVDDLAAVMEPGIAALLAVHARGVSAGAAAQALWREFVAARTAIIALVAAEA